MGRVVVRFLAQALIVAAPWIAAHAGVSGLGETNLKVLLSMLGLCIVLGWDVVDLYIPREQLRRFGKDYADKLAKQFEKPAPYPQLGTDVRINIMYVAWFGMRFKWMANYGFVTSSRSYPDVHMCLARWQGAAGQAVALQDTVWVDLRDQSKAELTFAQRWFFGTEFRLWHSQFKRTAHVLAVLSVPIVRAVGTKQNPKPKIVGVINVDAVSAKGLEWLENKETRQQLVTFLGDYGSFLAFLD